RDPAARWAWAKSLQLTTEGAPVVVMASDREVLVGDDVTLALPVGPAPPAPDAVAAIDFNYDFRNDLAIAAPGGLRLFQQTESGKFADVTSRMGVSATITGGAYAGAWAADIESEGDLDIVLAPVAGPPVVLRNNGDGTFKQTEPFSGVSALRGFVWADLDGDGDPDAAMADAEGKLFVFDNERAGQFRQRALPGHAVAVAAINAADLDANGVLDLVLLQTNGSVLTLSDKGEGRDWQSEELHSSTETGDPAAGGVKLFVADLDNNGGVDLVTAGASGGAVWLSDEQGKLKPAVTFDKRAMSVSDVTGDGRMDLVGVSREGQAVRLASRGTKDYHYQIVRPRAATSTGDQRINSFGIGGEMEVRAGLVFQKQLITGPAVHFGLGEKTQSDVVRIVWPNGTVQAEYELAADEAVLTEQRLKGSCPWLFAYDGKQMAFVTDFIWRSPLGLRINAQDTANVAMTEDRVKIGGRQLAPRDGFYDLRITADLWETHFFDHVSLMVVDHPAGTEVFIDERFAVPPPKLDLYVTAPPRPVVRAVDDLGNDVTAVLASRDGRYLDTFERGAYQGVTRDHYVEVELPKDAPQSGRLYLVAQGWIHPTDSSINVALGQGAHAPPRGLALEVADGRGGWVVARPNLGFPAGKTKTVLLDLDGVFAPGAPRRLRLRTNLEIYWDSIEWAAEATGVELKTERLAPASAELRYRGFSVVGQADRSSPELPEYRVATTEPLWLDLVGYHTRFGDVMELLTVVDDRYVIMN
ncbi:MAG TPA: CRTAC1 family protein, partial [Blastocatellia bacterium]|nr:CRTAC1 family protein [Blastocatellia bacterium]